MNSVEKLLMNNPVRSWLIEHYALPKLNALAKLSKRDAGKSILEIGCGSGYGLIALLKQFRPALLHALDSDPKMIQMSRRRLMKFANKYPTAQTRTYVGDAAAIDSIDCQYDYVFGFGVLHHIPDWQKSVREIFRVLKPGGRVFLEESFAKFILHPIWRKILDHPKENRFDALGLSQCLAHSGFTNIHYQQSKNQYMGWLVADKII